MFYLPSKHHLDTMFVILCVVAGANSHSISNTSRTPINRLDNQYRASFIDFILDASLSELPQSLDPVDKELESQYSSDKKLAASRTPHQSQTVCNQLLLNGNQMRMCLKHQDILETVIPQIMHLIKRECQRVSNDFRWNCSAIDPFLDRSNPLAYTREAALVRSMLSASMMYLIVKLCSEENHRSCGCVNYRRYSTSESVSFRSARHVEESSIEESAILNSQVHQTPSIKIAQQNFSPSDLSKLVSGSPLRLTKYSTEQQGCLANLAFASAFTQLFIDSDEVKALNKAFKILNEDRGSEGFGTKRSIDRRLIDPDMRDLAYTKWAKSATSIHNSHVGRQIVREATRRRCRCHGLSGVCQFQTCWTQLLDFTVVSSGIKSIYKASVTRVEVHNDGSFDKPDLSMARIQPRPSTEQSSSFNYRPLMFNDLGYSWTNLVPPRSDFKFSSKITPKELIYLYESPNYCDPIPVVKHPGTVGRPCLPNSNLTRSNQTSKKEKNYTNEEVEVLGEQMNAMQNGFDGSPGSCELLCCNRGYHRELVLDMVNCDCRFLFCCSVICDRCIRQRVHHYCL